MVRLSAPPTHAPGMLCVRRFVRAHASLAVCRFPPPHEHVRVHERAHNLENRQPTPDRFTNDAGMILGRYRTGLCAKCQRKVARTIKAARQMGFVPTVSDYEIRDTGPGGLFAWAGKGERVCGERETFV